MSGKIVNLRQARKRKARVADAKTGDANAARFGLSKVEREVREMEKRKATRDLDGHKRETPR